VVDLEVFYLGHLKNLYTIQYNTIGTKRRSGDPIAVFKYIKNALIMLTVPIFGFRYGINRL